MENKYNTRRLYLNIITVILILFYNIVVVFIGRESTIVIISLVFSIIILTLLCFIQYLMKQSVITYSDYIINIIDDMLSGRDLMYTNLNSETLLAKVSLKLQRLYEIMKEETKQNRNDKLKVQELISDVSHQVKTPITNLKMINTTIKRNDVSEEKKEDFLNLFNLQLDKLEFLMQALIKASRLETGVIILKTETLPFYDTIAEALGSIIFQAEEKEIDVVVNCDTAVKVMHDKKWTVEALFNILDNAVKYTLSHGSITVSVEELESYVKINIADTGKGIPQEHLNDIFKRFYREDSVHQNQGIGIGLYLSREIITKQGGYILVNSEMGKGSTFSVYLLKGLKHNE